MIIIDAKHIIQLIKSEIERFNEDQLQYIEAMDNEIAFSKDYWKYRDKYHEAFVLKNYLIDLQNKILNR